MKHLIMFLGFFALISCKEKSRQEASLNENEEIEVYDFAGLESLLRTDDDRTYVVNFWATWCKPCIEELPYFEALQAEHGDEVKVILVSLDFPDKLESQLKPFVEKRNIKAQVALLDDPYENEWIPKVDESWSGAIPATLIFNKSKRVFYEGSFTQESLNEEIIKFIKI
jgi:thiol-disulfide isomerase/thioredoxin